MTWLAVIGYEDLYEVSSFGEVRSVNRTVIGADGIRYPKKGRVLLPHPVGDLEYLGVSLWKDGSGTTHYVHRLVAQAHIPNPSKKREVNHKDGVRTNNLMTNLEWVTRTENALHAIQTGLKIYTNRLTKAEFVECLFAVIEGESYLSLTKRVPYKVPFLSTKIRAIANELGVVGELNESLHLQRVKRAQKNGAKNQ